MSAEPPGVRPLPHHEQHRRALLAAIEAESAAESAAESTAQPATPASVRGAGPRLSGRLPRTALPPGRRAFGQWLSGRYAPVAAAGAVLVIAGAAVGVHSLLPKASGTPAGPAASPAVAQTAHATSSPSAHVSATPVLVPPADGRLTAIRTYEVVAPVKRLVVNDPVGAVSVTGGATAGVRVTASISYKSVMPSVNRKLRGGTLTLGYSPCGDCGVSFRVTVPGGTDVTVHGGTGNVSLTGLSGDVSVQDHTGRITGTGLSGPVERFRSGLGAIDVTLSAPPRQLAAVAGTGTVTVALPSSASYRVSAKTQVGEVHVTVARSRSAAHVITASTRRGTVTVTTGR